MLTLTAPSVRVVFIFAAVPLMFVRSERPGVSVAEFCVPAGVAPGTVDERLIVTVCAQRKA